jgi:hypothetical protein
MRNLPILKQRKSLVEVGQLNLKAETALEGRLLCELSSHHGVEIIPYCQATIATRSSSSIVTVRNHTSKLVLFSF